VYFVVKRRFPSAKVLDLSSVFICLVILRSVAFVRSVDNGIFFFPSLCWVLSFGDGYRGSPPFCRILVRSPPPDLVVVPASPPPHEDRTCMSR